LLGFKALTTRTFYCTFTDCTIEIVNLISDDEDSDNDFASLSPSPAAPSPSPAPPGRPNELPARKPAPYGPPNPLDPPEARNLADAEAWEDFVDEDGMNGFDGYDDMDIRDPELERIMMEDYNREARNRRPVVVPYRNGEPSGHNQENKRPGPQPEPRAKCVDQVMSVFPGICRDHVSGLYDSVSQSSDVLIAHILDKMDKGDAYPNAKREKEKSLKRKRPFDEDEEATRKYGAVDRIMPYHLKTIM
jgi:TRIAD3 protein (E3 ubiquitin-protein ligase RNF216)